MKTPECKKYPCNCHNGPQNERQHTPTPWFRNIRAGGKYPVIFSGRNNHVCVVSQQTTGEETEANIDFIVNAANSHEALLNVARWLINEREAGTDKGLLPDGLLNATRKAIIQAEGGK